MDVMITNAEEFYQSLGVAYRIVNLVSGKRCIVCVRGREREREREREGERERERAGA
jgi:seryl-tRNA synthetase